MTTEEEHVKAIRVLLRLKNERRTDNQAEIEFFRTSLSFFQKRPDCIWCCYADICSEVLQFALLDSSDASLWFRKQTITCLSSCRDCIEYYYNSRTSFSADKASFFQAKLRQFDEERLMDIFNRYLAAGKEERKQACFKYAIAEVLVFPGWFGVPGVSVAIERVLEVILAKGKLNYSERPAGIFLATLHRNELIRKWATELIEAQNGEPCETDLPNYMWKTVFFMYNALPVDLRAACLEDFRKHIAKLKLKLETADYEVFTELVLGELAANSYRLDEYLLGFVVLFSLLKPQFDFKMLNAAAFEAILLNPAFSTIKCPAQFAESAFIEHFLYAIFIDNVGDYARLDSILSNFFPRLLEAKFKSADFQEYLVKCLTRYLCEYLGDSSINYQVLSKLLTLDRIRYRRCIEIAFDSLVAHDLCRTGPAKDIRGFLVASEFAPETYQRILPDLTGINVEAAILRALKIHFRQGKFDFEHVKKRIDVLTLNRPVQDPALALLLYWLLLGEDLKVRKEKGALSAAVLWSLNALVYTRFHGFKVDRIVSFLSEGVCYGDCTSWLCQVTFPFFKRSKDFPFAEVAELASIVAQISSAHIKAVEEEYHVYLLADEEFNSTVLESGLTGLLEFIIKRKGGLHFVRLARKFIILAAKFKIDLAACKAGQILRVIATSTVIVEEYRDQLVEAVQVYTSTAGGNVSFNLALKTKTTAVPKSEIDAEVARRLAFFEKLDQEYLERHQDGHQRGSQVSATISSKPASKIGQLRQEMSRTVTAPVKKRGQIPAAASSKAPKLTGSADDSTSSGEESLAFSSELFKEPVKSVPVITPVPQRSVKLINSQKEEEPLTSASGKPIQTKAQKLCAIQRKMQRDWLAAHKLHRFILSLDFDTLKEEDTTALSQKLLQIQQIPSNFANYDAYARIFEPLLLMESQAQVFQSKEEAEGRATFYPCSVESVQFVDDFHEILFNFGDNAAHRLFTEQDLVVGHENHQTAEGNILGIVTSAASRMTGFEVNVRFFLASKPGTFAVKLTMLRSHWRFAKLCNLVTASREYLALHNLPLFKSVEWILAPRFHQATSQVQEKISALSFYCQRNFSLNPSQAQAIAFSLLNDNFFSLIQGPPGTGKTRTIEGFLGTCLSANKTSCPVRVSARKVLICAPSNAAIDEIVRRIKGGVSDANGHKTALKIVRVGALDMIHEDVQELSLDILADTKTELQFASELAKYEEQRQEFLAVKQKVDHAPDVERSVKTQFHQLKDSFRKGTKAMEETRQKVRAQILREAQVVCCTLSAAGNEIIGRVDGEFEMVIIDEACQAVELSALIPLQYGCKRAILIGDPNQLPPTIISQAACSFTYEQSLFQRLQRAHPASVQMLSVQYRMHPEISVFPSRYFYHGKLNNGPNVLVQNTRSWHLKPDLKLGPYQFFDAPGKESFRNFNNGRQGKSMMNEIEAEMTIDLISKLASENPSYNVSYF